MVGVQVYRDKLTAAGVNVLDWPTAYTLCNQFIDAEVYLVEKKVLHRNVKPDDVLIKTDGSLCLCDFGDAVKVRLRVMFAGVHWR